MLNLSIKQTQELLSLIDKNQLTIIGSELGSEFLTDYDRDLLKTYGINPDTLYRPESSSIQTSFHFGMLAEAIGQLEARELTYEVLRQYVKDGNYIPVSEQQKAVINSIKMQSFSSLKSLNGKIFSDINNVLTDTSLAGQQEFLAEEVRQGLIKKQTVSKIAHEIAHKTGDWGRNFDRIIETACQNAFEQGKAAEIQRQHPHKDPSVYKRVFPEACKHCIRLYLTEGLGSAPIIFKLSELIANGSNIGRKVADWKAVLESMHPHCRCSLQYFQEGYIWNKASQAFDIPIPDFIEEIKKKRPLVRVVIGGKEKFL